jgi:hypothetical protein
MWPKSINIKRRVLYYLAVFPFFGRNHYERLNSRLNRQIKIREEKRNGVSTLKKTKLLFPGQQNIFDDKKLFFDVNYQ